MKLSRFLVKAKIATYAGGGDEIILEDGCKQLIYQEGDFKYRDRYYGSNPFFGEEIVWQKDEMVWAMNYFGKVSSDIVTSRQVYSLLKSAMRLVKEERPFRGPEYFVHRNFEYTDESEGDINEFTGIERILFRGEEIYRLNYHGGSV